jgi:hypothetical protein
LVVLRLAFGAAFLAVVVLAVPQHLEQPAFFAADLAVPFALGERFTLAFLAVVLLVAFRVVAINYGSSIMGDVLLSFRLRR